MGQLTVHIVVVVVVVVDRGVGGGDGCGRCSGRSGYGGFLALPKLAANQTDG